MPSEPEHISSLPFATTTLAPGVDEEVLRVLRSGWLTTGQETVRFERDLAEHLGASHAVAVSSCTAAIELSLRALQLPLGAAVLTPSLTFCSAVQVILRAGLRPVLVDVDETTLTPNEETTAAAARRVGGRVAAMVVQHMAGYPVSVSRLAAAAGISTDYVVEDAAHALGAVGEDGPVGRSSRACCLSFYATKNLPIGEGGAVITNDPMIADAVTKARLHGMSRDAWRRYQPGGTWRYDVDRAGMKANFTDLQAAIGRMQLREFDRWQDRRERLAQRYDEQLRGLPGIATPQAPPQGRHAWHLYQLRVQPEFGLRRDQVIEALAELGIGTSVHFIPVHHLSFFQQALGPEECRSVPVTDAVFPTLLSVPFHQGLEESDVDRVCAALWSLRSTVPAPRRALEHSTP